jgi:hypothetical protein
MLKAVRGIISRLQRLSIAIRRALRVGRATKIAEFQITNQSDFDLCADLTEYSIKVIEENSPKSDEGLRKRLLAAILLRQKRFIYYKSRRAKTKA